MRKDGCGAALAMVMLAFTGASHAQKSPATSMVYSCVDAGGRRLTADRPIAACADREQQVIMPGGATRTVGPSYSERERAEQAAQQRRDAEERYRANDGKRRERALATRYPSKAAHDVERAEAVDVLRAQIRIVQERRGILLEDRKKIDQDMEFYKRDPSKAPALLQSRLDGNRHDLKEVDEQIATINDEIKATHLRFDEEAQSLKPYWSPAAK